MTPAAAREFIVREVFPRLSELISRCARDLHADLMSAGAEAGGLCVDINLKISVLRAPDPVAERLN